MSLIWILGFIVLGHFGDGRILILKERRGNRWSRMSNYCLRLFVIATITPREKMWAKNGVHTVKYHKVYPPVV